MGDIKTLQAMHINSFNPYEALYPGYRVVSRDTLHLIKMLREQGISVVVEPDNGTKLNYLAEKGLREIFTDPIILFAFGIPISIITGIISAWLYDKLKGRTELPEINVAIEVDQNGNIVRYNHRGEQISDQRFQMLVNLLNTKTLDFTQSLQAEALDSEYTIPIHLEHTGRIVAWAKKPSFDDKGMFFRGINVFDTQTWKRIRAKELQGLIVAGIIRRSTCTICNHDYVDCNHIAGQLIKRKKCSVRIDDILLAECSIVKKPIQQMAKLEFHRQK